MPRLQPRIPRQVVGKSKVKAELKRERTAEGHVRDVRGIGICAATGRECRTEAHHLMRVGPGERGLSMRTAGRWTIPLSPEVRREITPHGDPEAVLMERYGLDARALASALWAARGDDEAMRRAVERAYQDARQRLRLARLSPDISAPAA